MKSYSSQTVGIIVSDGSKISHGAPTPKKDTNLLFGQFFRKLHENEEILLQGSAFLVPLLDPPMNADAFGVTIYEHTS